MKITSFKISDELIKKVESIIQDAIGTRYNVEVKLTINISMDEVMKMISEVVNMPVEDILSNGRNGVRRNVARQLFCFICSEYCKANHQDIADYINRERSNVSRSIDKVVQLVESNDIFMLPAIEMIVKKMTNEDQVIAV